jgi:cardiolipin synthase A/B
VASRRHDVTADTDGAPTSGNRVTLFDDGEALFARVCEAMRLSRERIWVETFIFTPDETGRATLDLMADAATRGCDVVLLFDQLGSHVTNLGFYAPIEAAGGSVAVFNPLRPWQRLGRRAGSWFRRRNHRKTIVADDVGFCGGHNFSRSYMGPPPHHFYDMTVMLEGPCVRDAGRLFLDSLGKTTGATRPLPDALRAQPDGVPVRVLAHDGRRRPSPLVHTYRDLLDGARERVTILMAYFAPDGPLRRPLVRAAERGVDVRLLVAGATDVPVARWAGEHTYDDLLGAGVRIWQLQEPHLHAKAIVVDGEHVLIGTFDINTAQRQHTMEGAVVAQDPALAERVERAFDACLPRSLPIDPARWKERSRFARALEWASHRLLRA